MSNTTNTSSNIKISSERHLNNVLIRLLKGYISPDEKKHWEKLLLHQEYIRQYFAPLGLSLALNQEDGYAYLRSSANQVGGGSGDAEEDEDLEELTADRPASQQHISLARKFPLSFDVSLLIVLLREALEQFDKNVSDDFRLILSQSDIFDLLKTFFPAKNDEVLLIKKFDVTINKVLELGFLKELKNNKNHYEVKRILKAFFDASKLQEMKEIMKNYLVKKGGDLQ